jgi:hypothetical protein
MGKRQHWLPQFYLRAFRARDAAGATARLWVHFRDGPDEPQLKSINDIAAQRYLYAPVTTAGERDHSVDNRLQEIESLLGPMWPTITEGYVDLDREPIRMGLALFLATLYARHPQRLEEHRTVGEGLVAFLDRLPKDDNGNPEVSRLIVGDHVREFVSSEWTAFRQRTPDQVHQAFVDAVVPTSADIAKILLPKRWAIVTSSEPVFATCDAPLVVRGASERPSGFGTPGTVIHLPLSPWRFLVVEDSGLPNGYYATKPGFADAMNYQTWCAADRYLLTALDPHVTLEGVFRFVDANGITQR